MKGTAAVYLKLLVEKAREEGLELGGTLIQKGMYLLDDALGADLDIHFEAYLYGPYSREVDGLIDYVCGPGDKSSDVGTADAGQEVAARVERVIALFKNAQKRFPKYADFKARLWELLGTTDYVMRYVRFTSDPETEKGLKEIARAVRGWKKYFDEDEVKEAARFLHEELRWVKN